MNAPCCDVFQLTKGKIKSFNCYPSGTVVLTQLGVLETLKAVHEGARATVNGTGAEEGVTHCPRERRAFRNHSAQRCAQSVAWS